MKAADPLKETKSEESEERETDQTDHHLPSDQMIKDGGEEAWKPYGFAALTVGLGIAYSYLKT